MKKYATIYYSELLIDNEISILCATDKGLCFVSPFNENLEDIKKYFPDFTFILDESYTKKYKENLKQYFSGNTKILINDINEFDLYGTTLQKAVWTELLNIPYGNKVSYSYIAKKINKPKAIRPVANAVGKNPCSFFIPCHRVLKKNGNISGFRGGIKLKKQLLNMENISYKN